VLPIVLCSMALLALIGTRIAVHASRRLCGATMLAVVRTEASRT
jgi:hypothetical protein